MEQIDLLNKEKLTAALRFTMQTGTENPSKAIYRESGFVVEVEYYNNEVTVLVTVQDDTSPKKMVDHGLSATATQFLKTRILMVRMEQSMSRKQAK